MFVNTTFPLDGYKVAERLGNQSVYFLRCDKQEVGDDDDKYITCQETTVVVKNADYATLTSAFIHTKYTQDDELALLNNYITEPDSHAEEYQTYQDWRAYCKAASRTIFPTVTETNEGTTDSGVEDN